MFHGDLFRGTKCPLLSCKVDEFSTNPYGVPYQQINDKFEALKTAILKKYEGVIDEVVVCWSCDFQKLKSSTIKTFIETLPLPPKYRLVPRDGKV